MKVEKNQGTKIYEGQFARKINLIDEFESEKSSEIRKYRIEGFIVMNEVEYDEFANSLMKMGREWLRQYGGWSEDGIYKVLAIVCPKRSKMILADPSGHDYIRYVSILTSSKQN